MFFLSNVVCLAEKQQIPNVFKIFGLIRPGLELMICSTRGEHNNVTLPLWFAGRSLRLILTLNIKQIRGRDRMVGGYHHKRCGIDSLSWQCVIDATLYDKLW